MKVGNNYFNYQNYETKIPYKQSSIKFKGGICRDIFEKTNPITFTSQNHQNFEIKNPPPIKLKTLEGVDKAFVQKLQRYIDEFPSKWLKLFDEKGYKVIAAPTLSKAYNSERVFDPFVYELESRNPKGALGVTYDDSRKGKRFFAFCDKPPYTNDYLKNIVNHELSHGIVNSLGLDKNVQVLNFLKQDVGEIKTQGKLNGLTEDELGMISYYFFNPKAHLPVDEILADLLAWNNGGGCYGSGFIMGIKNPDIMKNLFPNLNEYLSNL